MPLGWAWESLEDSSDAFLGIEHRVTKSVIIELDGRFAGAAGKLMMSLGQSDAL